LVDGGGRRAMEKESFADDVESRDERRVASRDAVEEWKKKEKETMVLDVGERKKQEERVIYGAQFYPKLFLKLLKRFENLGKNHFSPTQPPVSREKDEKFEMPFWLLVFLKTT